MVDLQLRIVRLEFDRRFEEKVGILMHTETCADVGKQPHTFDVTWILLHEGADDALGVEHPAFMNEIGDSQQFTRQLLKAVTLSGRFACSSSPFVFSSKHLAQKISINFLLIKELKVILLNEISLFGMN